MRDGETEELVIFFYDKDGVVRGPFPEWRVLSLYRDGYFTRDSLFMTIDSEVQISLADLVQQFGAYNPFHARNLWPEIKKKHDSCNNSPFTLSDNCTMCCASSKTTNEKLDTILSFLSRMEPTLNYCLRKTEQNAAAIHKIGTALEDWQIYSWTYNSAGQVQDTKASDQNPSTLNVAMPSWEPLCFLADRNSVPLDTPQNVDWFGQDRLSDNVLPWNGESFTPASLAAKSDKKDDKPMSLLERVRNRTASSPASSPKPTTSSAGFSVNLNHPPPASQVDVSLPPPQLPPQPPTPQAVVQGPPPMSSSQSQPPAPIHSGVASQQASSSKQVVDARAPFATSTLSFHPFRRGAPQPMPPPPMGQPGPSSSSNAHIMHPVPWPPPPPGIIRQSPMMPPTPFVQRAPPPPQAAQPPPPPPPQHPWGGNHFAPTQQVHRPSTPQTPVPKQTFASVAVKDKKQTEAPKKPDVDEGGPRLVPVGRPPNAVVIRRGCK